MNSRALRYMMTAVACRFFWFTSRSQSFVKSLEILKDSVPIVVGHAHQGSGLRPLNTHCLCLFIPADVDGKVLVELLGGARMGFASFYAYASKGRLWSCFKSDSFDFKQDTILFEGVPANLMNLRRPTDTNFR